MKRLKPCPFCGEKPTIISPEPRIKIYKGTWHCIVCYECNLFFGYDEDYGGEYKSKERLIEAWNDRKDGDGK